MIKDEIRKLHTAYLPYRNTGVPFPIESVVVWYFLLAVQRKLNVAGNILEMGVEHGGTAFLEAASLEETETLTLIDLKQSERYAQMAETLPDTLKKQITFHECSTRSPALDEVQAQRFRFVHIDAGHSMEDVCDDFERFADCVAEDGLLCLDDVFEIRWPGVTEAVFKMVPESNFVPVFFANRKLYLAHKAKADTYLSAFDDTVSVLSDFGQLRHWKEPMLGGTPTIVKLQTVSAQLDALKV